MMRFKYANFARSYPSPNYARALHEIYDLTVRVRALHSGTQRVTPSPNYLDSDHRGLIIPSLPPYLYRCSVRRYANST